MKLVYLLALLSLIACEAKKSTGTSNKIVYEATTSKNNLSSPDKTKSFGAKNTSCDSSLLELDTPPQGAVSVTSSELVSREEAYYELKSVEAITSSISGEIKLIEKRVGRRYFQSCKNLDGVTSFEIRYSAPQYFSAKDGAFGKLNGQKSLAHRYILRFDPKVENGRARGAIVELKVSGKISENLSEQLVEFADSKIRYFKLDNGDILIRTQKDKVADGSMRLTTSLLFELKAR